MTAVELAYPLLVDGQAHQPDDIVDLPEGLARQLVRDGRARWHIPTPDDIPAQARAPRAAPTPTAGGAGTSKE
jgi:hypothetical protein